MGYHTREIVAGVFGEPSKVAEEAAEFMDAVGQNNQVMALMEASDLIGAIEGWLEAHHPSVTLTDLIVMKNATARAFADGTRTSRAEQPRFDLGRCLNCGKKACGPHWCTNCGAA